jgi:hypothetical protein
MERMRELVQQSTSSSTQLAATAEQMSRLSKTLLTTMGRFVLDNGSGALRQSGQRPIAGESAPRISAERYAELVNS